MLSHMECDKKTVSMQANVTAQQESICWFTLLLEYAHPLLCWTKEVYTGHLIQAVHERPEGAA